MNRILQLALVTSLAALGGSAVAVMGEDRADDSVYEIRSYHFDPTLITEYRSWAEEMALPYIRSQMDVVGFWIEGDIPTEVTGEDSDPLGTANVTWIIRWPSKETRDAGLQEAFGSAQWAEIFQHVPGGSASYRRIEASFFDAL